MEPSRLWRGPQLTRRALAKTGLTLGGASALLGPSASRSVASAAAVETRAEDVTRLMEQERGRLSARAVIYRVTEGGDELVTGAIGESMTGEPATTDMHFRNGAVAVSYVATALLRLVDRGLCNLDDVVGTWLPDLPDADRVSLRMLADMTAGYPDYVQHPDFVPILDNDPFRAFTSDELIAIGLSTPRVFDPGENWDYSHTDIVILGQALAAIGGAPLAALIESEVLVPLGLTGTSSSTTAAIPAPVLHAFSSQRRESLAVSADRRFYEETTFWNPSWTLAEGSVQTTTIADMTATAIAIGEGTLLTAASHAAQVEPRLIGFGEALDGCPACNTLSRAYSYGLGVAISGSWLIQDPAFGGYSAVEAYLPEKEIAIAVAATYSEDAFDSVGNQKQGNLAKEMFRALAGYLTPDDIPYR